MNTAPIYVVVCQNDRPHPRWGADAGWPIIHEQYTRTGTLENMRARADRLERNGQGDCSVGRVVLEGEPGFLIEGDAK